MTAPIIGSAEGAAIPVNRYLVALTVMIGTLVEVIDTSVANVALPHIQGSFSAGQDEVTWVITSYLVANAIILPLSGWLGNYFGRKRTYLSCFFVFVLASMGAGAAPSMPVLILMRVVQGLAGGAMVPMSQAILLESFPREEHGKAMAIFGIGVVFGPIIGPTLGGWITDTIDWRWVFYINGPIGLIGLLLAFFFVQDPPYLHREEGRVDYWSFVFVAVGLGSLEVLLNRGERYDWFHSPFIQWLALGSVLGIALFVWRSLTAERPLVDLSAFRSREFAAGTLLMFLLGFGLYGSFTMLPLYAQKMLGYSATLAGLLLSPGGIASLVSMFLVGALVGRVDTRMLVAFGAVTNAAAMFLLRFVDLHVDFDYMMLGRVVQGFGMGFLFVPLTAAAFVKLRPEQIGSATGLFNLLRNEGGSIGIAISSTVLAQHAQSHHLHLAEHVSVGNPILLERLSTLRHVLDASSGLDPVSNQRLAQAIQVGELQRQAFVMAYDDVFFMLAVVFVVFLPLTLLLGKARGRGPAVH